MSTRPPVQTLSVLFVDRTGGTLAVMAEALLRQLGGGKFTAQSAGVEPVGEVSQFCVAELQARKIPAGQLAVKGLQTYQNPERSVKIDIVVRLGNAVKELPPQLYGVPAKVDWLIDDPADATDDEQATWKTRKAFVALKEKIEILVKTDLPAAKGELQMVVQKIGSGF